MMHAWLEVLTESITEGFTQAEKQLNDISSENLVDLFEIGLDNMRQGLDELLHQANTQLMTRGKSSDRLETHELSVETADQQQQQQEMAVFVQSAVTEIRETLDEITSDELEIVATLSLSIARGLLPIAKTLALSFCEDACTEAREEPKDDRASRITIEELVDNPVLAKEKSTIPTKARESKKIFTATRLRLVLEQLLTTFKANVSRHPIQTCVMTCVSLPIVCTCVLPLSSVMGFGLVMETLAPEFSASTVNVLGNAFQALELWLLIVKVACRRLKRALRKTLVQLREESQERGVVTTALNWSSRGLQFTAAVCSSTFQLILELVQRRRVLPTSS